MRTTVDDFNVEWDARKNELNISKHKIDFEVAKLVFADPNRIEIYDYLHSDIEDRYATIGIVNNLLMVIYTERGKNIRLISARVATALERRIYYEKNS